jgi:hypothetical protein
MTPQEEAKSHGFKVDTHCYPWVAYTGPRFKPTKWFTIPTDIEFAGQQLNKAVKNIQTVYESYIN